MSNITMQDIESLLENEIRPILAKHNGDIIINDYTDNILRIRLTGQCSGCPSASLTTEEIISAKVKEHFPEIKDVILITGVSDDLLMQAKALMTKHT
ncbi:NifU family protein [Megasphaera paucivorans]|uniref:Fe-S cluster biogenesis protein NfuA, 4Fe-4S-binding domain n=1 Tax=Megasphaera paucivorans TaxID=349095 RepID=A0A1G9Z405_9FIRM|nr:NifU family protein [Megasphaera paucivorans]SDN15443.1 Fe-S cluster biogenesis protein NfuA, 4Fe-4S-binding domain [Megasphaera paucivorans]